MRQRALIPILSIGLLIATPGLPATRFVLHAPAADASNIASRHGLTIDSQVLGHDVFLALAGDAVDQPALVTAMKGEPEVVDFEPDGHGTIPEVAGANVNQSTTSILDGIATRSAVQYYGAWVPNYYVTQSSTALIRLAEAQSTFAVSGAGIVAVIDTGIDPNHRALAGVLVDGYDFTRNLPGLPSELLDISQSTTSILDQSTTSILDRGRVVPLNPSTAAILSQSTTSILDTTQIPAAYGHGTMVAGIVHLVAPGAQIMPLKAFLANGTSTTFDIIRAVYYAADHGAKVINMSFSINEISEELMRAINYATGHGAVCVSSTGNLGREVMVFPAALQNVVGVASTDALDRRSSFSNYGASLADMAAPGEGVITTYPGDNYAAGWGTSFGTPLVSGVVALLVQIKPALEQWDAMQSLSKARPVSDDLGFGRLDALLAVQSRVK